MSSSHCLVLEAAAPAAGVSEAAAAAGLTNDHAAAGQAVRLGGRRQAAGDQVFAGDPKGRSPADEAAERAAAAFTTSHCDSAEPPAVQTCTLHCFIRENEARVWEGTQVHFGV